MLKSSGRLLRRIFRSRESGLVGLARHDDSGKSREEGEKSSCSDRSVDQVGKSPIPTPKVQRRRDERRNDFHDRKSSYRIR